MILYRITLGLDDDETPAYRTTRQDAHLYLKERVLPGDSHRGFRVERIAINPGAADIVDMLNGTYEFAARVSPIQTWKLGPRLGLIECNNGE